jgi:prepilin peptidase dependent protein B
MSTRLTLGYSLVELLVGCALGLVLTGMAVQLFARQMQAQREQLVEARLHQDLRAASDLIVRGLRRAGQHGMDDSAANPHRAIAITAASLTTSHTRDAQDNGVLDDRERTGFRLADGGLQAMVGGRWQALTDPAVVRIVRFDLAMTMHPALVPGECTALVTRELSIAIDGHPTADPQRRRRVRTSVTVRNDDVDASACGAAASDPDVRSRS